MNIEIRDTLTLSDDKKYLVASKTELENKKYFYLVEMNDTSNVKFCFEVNENGNIELEEIEDSKLITILIPLLAKEAEPILKEILEKNKN